MPLGVWLQTVVPRAELESFAVWEAAAWHTSTGAMGMMTAGT